MKISLSPQKVTGWLSLLLATSLTLIPDMIHPQNASAADKVRLVYGMFNCSLSVEALEQYAETGEINEELKFYAKFLDEQTLIQLRHWLQKPFYSDQVSMHRYTKSDEGENLLQEIGTAVTTHSERNGFYAIRSALVKAAGDGNSWTIIDVIEEFPTEHLQINTQQLFKLQKFWHEKE